MANKTLWEIRKTSGNTPAFQIIEESGDVKFYIEGVELTELSGVTATASELNILDGATVTTAEVNILDGVTATATELNYNDIATLGTGVASKAVVLDGSGDYTFPASGTTTVPSGYALTGSSGSTITFDVLNLTGNSNQIVLDSDAAASAATTITDSATAARTITLPDATDTLVGKATTDTFTNKTFDANATGNSLSNVETADIASGSKSGSDTTLITGTAGTASDLAIWNGDGDLVDGPTPPSGTIVGTSDTQTLTNKTINTASNTITVNSADVSDLASSTVTFTNKTFDANATGNSLSNVDVADLADGTDGELITWDAAGSATTVAVGTSGHVLTSNGSGAAPTFQASGAGDMVLATAQEYTATKNFNATTLTDAASIAWDASTNQVASVTLGGNRTLAAPSNLVDGATYLLRVIQDGTGSRTLVYNAVFKWPGGTAPTLSTGAADVDILTFVSDGTNMYGTFALDFS